MMVHAPIIVFAYKRPVLLRMMLQALAANEGAPQSELFIYCDGPKPNATEAERRAIEEVREVAKATNGFARLEVIAAPKNKGLAASVIDGVTGITDRYGRAIVVEEDVLVSPFFLRFMNDALDRYASDDHVLSVGAWNYFAKEPGPESIFFYRYPDSIAWATWQRAWKLLERDGVALRDALLRTGRMKALEADGQVAYFAPMLQAQIDGKVDSWAIRWTATSVLHGKLNLFPRISLAKHEGFGADATHERGSDDYNAGLMLASAPVEVIARVPAESAAVLEQWIGFVRSNFKATPPSLLKRFWRLLPSSWRSGVSRFRMVASSAGLSFGLLQFLRP